MHKHVSKKELLNFFLSKNQRKSNIGGNYLHKFKQNKDVESKECGKKYLI